MSSDVVPDVVHQLPDFGLQITVVMVGRICLLHGFFAMMLLCCRKRNYTLEALNADFKKLDYFLFLQVL